MWMKCGKKVVKAKPFVSIATKCFDLALKYLSGTDGGMNAKICLFRAQSILAGNLPNLLQVAINDARTYTEQHPRSAKVQRILSSMRTCLLVTTIHMFQDVQRSLTE